QAAALAARLPRLHNRLPELEQPALAPPTTSSFLSSLPPPRPPLLLRASVPNRHCRNLVLFLLQASSGLSITTAAVCIIINPPERSTIFLALAASTSFLAITSLLAPYHIPP
ncbi:uncharacterized protein K441DRAFT_735025, partial [Cenococcum geophilum 1.58]|uniref:uncharacterized protein n=1 Tax=Cenococcum geophilum 1.58 TaxID=794803 RepID=UPI00358DF7B9